MKFFVWGTSPAQNQLIKDAESTLTAQEEAKAKGFIVKTEEDWAVEVEGTVEEVERVVRYDPAVVGYVTAPVCTICEINIPRSKTEYSKEGLPLCPSCAQFKNINFCMPHCPCCDWQAAQKTDRIIAACKNILELQTKGGDRHHEYKLDKSRR